MTSTHGPSTYRNKNCRCDTCRAGNAQKQREAVNRRSQTPAAADQAGHGKASTYNNYRCRCELCTQGHRDKRRAMRARQKGATA